MKVDEAISYMNLGSPSHIYPPEEERPRLEDYPTKWCKGGHGEGSGQCKHVRLERHDGIAVR